MQEIFIALLIFACLVGASVGSLLIYERFPPHHRQDDTHNIVRLAANLFVVMTSLLLGLMINSAKNTYESIDQNVHAFATSLILLDRSLVQYGPETADTRKRLRAYVQQTLDTTWPAGGDPVVDDPVAERMLKEVGGSLRAIKPQDAEHTELWRGALQQLQKVVEQRWILVMKSEGTIPPPLIAMLVVWLILIFASFGYRAPRNLVVVATFFVAGALISAAIYLILDMDVPFHGPIRVSPVPVERVLAEIDR